LWTSTDFTAQGFRPNQMYKLRTPGGAEYEPPLGRCWANIESVFQNLLADNRMWFGKDGKSRPRVKTYLSETKGISSWTWWTNTDASHNQEAKKEINAILQHETPFDTPKPTRLIRRILEIATNPGDIVLDSFAGSGTTAHAVLMQNAEDGGSRKFVLVEMEDYAREITAERVKRVIEGYGTVKATGGGFRYCELGEPIKDENGALNPEVSAEALAKHLFFSEYGVPLETKATLPYIGSFNESGLYLFFDTFERKKLAQILKDTNKSRIVYAASCTIDPQKLKDAGITFRQLPFEIKDR
ncbi:MAG: site-specific DNA-methyltransferase, partial [Sulfuricurvum sp.]|nr:site-specific DNA-methyltransferase [Sulfuricurvum sp.]